jgi:hypothetical protein
MEKAKELAKTFSLSEELVDAFEVPPKTAKWGQSRKEIRDLMKQDQIEEEEKEPDESEEIEDDQGRIHRKLKLIDWKKSLVKANWEKAKTSVFNSRGDPRSMKSEQIDYCIGLLRYCPGDFEYESNKLE